MEGELIAASFISLAGGIFIYMLSNRNWFKRENFKIQKSNTMAQNKLVLKKMAKQLDVQLGTIPQPEKSLIDSLKDLDVDKVKDVLGFVQKEEEEAGEEEENVLEGAINEIIKNPELRKQGLNLLKNVTEKKDTNIKELR